MRRLLTAVLALGLLSLGGSAARATDHSTYTGHCTFDTVNDTTPGGQLGGQEHWSGTMDAAVVLTSDTHGNVVNATVTCEIRVNGVPAASLAGSGSGVVVFAGPVGFDAAAWDYLELCTTVDYTSDTTPTASSCQGPTTTCLDCGDPNLIGYTLDVVNALTVAYVDPQVCPRLQALAPGAGPVEIRPDGDVYIGSDWYWDCPPYETPPATPPGITPVDPPVAVPSHGPTGAGWDDGDRGLLALVTPATTDPATAGDPAAVAALCAFRRDADGTIAVTGTATAAGADGVTVRCTLLDAAGVTRYDRTAAGTLVDTASGVTGPLSVCTEGTGTWGTTTATTGLHCRYA
jgi:hypothetical protein